MARIYYHNPKRGLLNETDVVDFMDVYKRGDEIFWSEDNCAILNEVDSSQLEELKQQWKDYYEENF